MEFFSEIKDFIQYVWDWFALGIYEFVKDAFVLATKMAIYGWFQATIFAMEIGYEVFEQIMDEIGVSDQVQSMYSGLNGDIRAAVAFFGVPDALNIIISAIGTRFTMKFIPLLGR